MGVKPHRVFSPWEKNPAATRKLYKKLMFLNIFLNSNIKSENRFAVFSAVIFTLNEHKYSPWGFSPAGFFPHGEFLPWVKYPVS